MNLVYLSPHFPPNYVQFCQEANNLGIKVLGLGDTPYEALDPRLHSALTEYYRVDNLEDYDQLLRALGYFTHKHGKIDRLDSHNEYWLQTEARLRSDFNIWGLNLSNIEQVKKKSRMKEVFRSLGLKVAQGQVVKNLAEAQAFIAGVGYPVVVKPDAGVGALDTFKLEGEEDLTQYFARYPLAQPMMEEFISGPIVSFDGLVDREGRPVFYTAHRYSGGVMDGVNLDLHMHYHSYREIPAELEKAGLALIQGFGVKERFFHFEFFDNPKGFIPLEVNIRPPGGFTTDMFNFARDINCYQLWARLLAGEKLALPPQRPYHVCYIGRKHRYAYVRSHQEVLEALAPWLILHQPIESIFSSALGHYGYVVRSPQLADIQTAISLVQEHHPH